MLKDFTPANKGKKLKWNHGNLISTLQQAYKLLRIQVLTFQSEIIPFKGRKQIYTC